MKPHKQSAGNKVARVRISCLLVTWSLKQARFECKVDRTFDKVPLRFISISN